MKDLKFCVGIFEIDIVIFCGIWDLFGILKIIVLWVWMNLRNFDFDDIIRVFFVLFEVFLLEGWLEVCDVI